MSNGDVEQQDEGGKKCNPIWILKDVPPLIAECCDFLDNHGYDDEGIFRVTGSFKDINYMKEKYLQEGASGLDLSTVSAYSVAGVITHYFNESEEPIFPYEVYDLCIDCMEMSPESTRDECIRQVLHLLPPGNFRIIRRFVQVLVNCAKLADVNKMTPKNLSIAMSPTMLRPKVETIETLIAHGDTLTEYVCLLIENYESYFVTQPLDALPPTVPESFVQMFAAAKQEIEEKLPEGYLESLKAATEAQYEVPEEEKPIARIQALWKGYKVRKMLAGLDIAYQSTYNRATWDYIMRENNFIWAMKKAIRDFETHLGDNTAGKRIRKLKSLQNTKVLSWQEKNAEAEVKGMVSGFKAIIEVHQMVYEKLNTLWDCHWPRLSGVGGLLLQYLPLFIVYQMYLQMFCRVETLTSRKDANGELKKWLDFETGSGKFKRSLRSLLRLPFQHLSGCKVPMQVLVNCIITRGEEACSEQEKSDIFKAFALITRIATVADTIDLRINYQMALVLEDTLLGWDKKKIQLASTERRFIRKGPITCNASASYVFLFDDICLVGKESKDAYIYDFNIDMRQCTIEDTSRTGFLLRCGSGEDEQIYRFNCKDMNLKVANFVDFQKVIDHWKEDSFGIPLEKLLAREKTDIPRLVEKLCAHLLAESEKVGKQFFVLCADDEYSVNAFKNQLNSTHINDINLYKYSPQVIVDVLKQFLLELPQPLLNEESCVGIFDDKEQSKVNLVGFWEILQSLPDCHIDLLRAMAEFLSQTQWPAERLAQTWGHTIYRSLNQTVSQALKLSGVTNVVRELVMHYEALCDPHPSAVQALCGPQGAAAVVEGALASQEPVALRASKSKRKKTPSAKYKSVRVSEAVPTTEPEAEEGKDEW